MIKWLDAWTGEINGGGPVEFAGVIRGQGWVDDAVDELMLDDWIYVVRLNGRTVMSSRDKKRTA